MTLALRFVARSDVGLIREGNEDSGYAGPSLLMVADGMGGHAAGEVASTVAVSTLAGLDDDVPSTELLDTLAAAVNAANEAISDMVEKHPHLDGMGTTLTALLWSGRRVGIVHVGDSRAYLLRDGRLQQITHDHTFVQQLQDEGRITAEEAAVHPQRSLLLRALDGRSNPEPDLSVREVHPGDRYLVCSDGLSGVVSDDAMAAALTGTDLDTAADTLITAALRNGGPDNITCIVADLVEAGEPATGHAVVVGAAAGKHQPASTSSTSEIDLTGLANAQANLIAESRGSRLTGWWLRALIAGVALAVVIAGWVGYAWSQGQYYVGASNGQVAIFKGLHQHVLGMSLSRTYERSDIALTDLPALDRDRVRDTIYADDLTAARGVVSHLQQAITDCRMERAEASAAPTAEPTATAKPERTERPEHGEAPTSRPTATPTPDETTTPGLAPTTAPTPLPGGCAP
ncbi:MAG TPA: PP2C family serine/threonine-protein phosphatase [Sporichthyaceae bacterium]|jgi:protein phosphatase|nr:PP2C family serine/threonine-protein phosphatase [Sporichthyaceae bacterium]